MERNGKECTVQNIVKDGRCQPSIPRDVLAGIFTAHPLANERSIFLGAR